MSLDVSPLANAVARLDEGLVRFDLDRSDAQIRDGLFQRLEFTYDLAHKMLRRALEDASANPADIDRMTFPELIRTGIEQGLVAGGWENRCTWRAVRNITSHSYDEAKALQVTEAIPDFQTEARVLLARLQRVA